MDLLKNDLFDLRHQEAEDTPPNARDGRKTVSPVCCRGNRIPVRDEVIMKVVVLHGSARKGGDTDTLVEHFLRGLGEEGHHEATHFYAIDMEIGHCRACMRCAAGKGCVIDDDMQDVYPAFSGADIIVVATPMFWGYMTSQLKTLFDRLEAIVSPEHFGGKDFVLLIGYRHYYGSMVEWLDRIATGFGSRSHAITCRTYDSTTRKDLPISNHPDKLAKALELGRALGSRAVV
jgi:multimeric flavodoxin WrbA